MRTATSGILPVWRTPYQAKILWLLLRDTTAEYSLTDITTTTGIARATVHHEVERLVQAGLLTERRVGRARIIRANVDHPLTPALTEMARYTFGPPEIIAEHFAEIGASTVLVFGSWASRNAGIAGDRPHDIDVLVLADPEHLREVRRRAYRAAADCEPEIGLPVQAVVRATSAWDDPDDPLIPEIKASPFLTVIGDAA